METTILEVFVQSRTTNGDHAFGTIAIRLGDQEKTYRWAATRQDNRWGVIINFCLLPVDQQQILKDRIREELKKEKEKI